MNNSLLVKRGHGFVQRNSSNHENCNIKFSLTFVFYQITICQISFQIFDVKQIYTREKNKYLNSIMVFAFSISFFCWNEITKKSSIKEDTRKMENCKANHILDRSSHRRCSVRKDVLRNFAKFTGKHLCQGLFMSGPKACNFIKKRLWHRCFPVNFAKVLRTLFLQNTSRRLLLFRVNRVSDYYAKIIYIKVFLWIFLLWMLESSKILRISKNT